MNETVIDKKQLRTVLDQIKILQQKVEVLTEENTKLRSVVQTGKSASRIEPPETTNATRQKFEIAGLGGYLIAGEYEDGSLAELFVVAGRAGTTIQGLCDALAKVVSIAIQSGVPVKDIANGLRDLEFFPSGPVKHDQNIKGAKSIVDYIAKWLTKHYITKSPQKKVVNNQETIEQLGDDIAGDELLECPSCKSKSLKPKAIGCDSQCLNCGYIDSKGCSL